MTNHSTRSSCYIINVDLFIVQFVDVRCFIPQDNAELFAMMEKTRMYIFRKLDPEVHLYHNEQKKCCFNLELFNSNNALTFEIMLHNILLLRLSVIVLVIKTLRFGSIFSPFYFLFILSHISHLLVFIAGISV